MKGFCLEVSGDFACFTRPEMKVERVSYDVITPSAGRAIFEAIFWKPAIKWHIKKIEVLNPIRWTSIRRNEVNKVASVGSSGFFADDGNNRAQRASLLLRDVRYRLHAQFDFIPPEKRRNGKYLAPEWLVDEEEKSLCRQAGFRLDEREAKYAAMFARRVRKGQHFMQPYLGCREFSCSTVRLIKDFTKEPAPIDESRDLGFMLYDMDFSDPKEIIPMFYRAAMNHGVITVPKHDSAEVLR